MQGKAQNVVVSETLSPNAAENVVQSLQVAPEEDAATQPANEDTQDGTSQTDAHQPKQYNKEATSQLFDAVKSKSVDKVNQLIADGANVNIIDRDGWTPLMYASGYGTFAMVQTLLKADAIVDVKSNFGQTALSVAEFNCTGDKNKIIALLKQPKHDDVQPVQDDKEKTMWYAEINQKQATPTSETQMQQTEANSEEIFMFCKYCGKQIEDDSKFCSGCGAKLQPTDSANKHDAENEANSKSDAAQSTSAPNKAADSFEAEAKANAARENENGDASAKNNFAQSTSSPANTIEKGAAEIKKMNPLVIASIVLIFMSFFLDYYGIFKYTALVLALSGSGQIKKGKGTGKTAVIVCIAVSAILSFISVIRIINYARYEAAAYGAVDGLLYWLGDLLNGF